MQPDNEVAVPEQTPPGIYDESGRPFFFNDPAIDRLVSVILRLTSEVWVLTERLETIEQLAQTKGHLTGDEIKQYRPGPAEAQQREADRDRFVQSVLGPLREVRR